MYARWRTDKPREEGFSHELISCDFDKVKDQTTMDELNVYPYPGIDTLYKSLRRRADDPRMGAMPWLGTRVGTQYQWMSMKESADTAKHFGAGCMALGLIPEVEAEDKTWRFIGIQAKNRKEWNLIHLANMHTGTTTVALYDTLGAQAARYVIDQTEMTTICCSKDLVHKIINLKMEDDDMEPQSRMLHRLKNVVCFEGDCGKDDLANADKCGIKVFTFGEVVEQGINSKDFVVVEPKPDDCMMFSYTSGTTGDPKGVKLTHRMLIQAAASV